MKRNGAAVTRERIRTMEEFSIASGISRPTLSRFFNDPQSVRPSSRTRIEAAMDMFGYRPNLFAVNFNRRNPKTLGILVPSLIDPFYAGIVECIERQALEAGYWTVIQNSRGDPDREAEAIATLISLKVAGAVIIALGHASRAALYRNASQEMALVFVDARADVDGAFVGTDNKQSVSVIVDYLMRSGSAPSYFDMPEVNQNAVARRQAYETAMQERGMEPLVHRLNSSDWNFEKVAFEEASRVLAVSDPMTTTILCASDRIAFGVMAAASQRGIPIGRSSGLRIAGHDDHPLSRYTCPSLTTVAQDGERLASISLDALLKLIGGDVPAVSERYVEANLIVRDSA